MSGMESENEPVRGERGTTVVDRAASMQSRLSSVLAVGLMTVLGLGLLIWYYANALTRPARARAVRRRRR